DVEWYAEEDVGGPLIELAGEPPLGDVELEQAVARGQRHPFDVGRVPGGDDEAARIRIAPDRFDDARHLVDGPTVRPRPRTPLPAVHRPEVAMFIGPFVPDRHPMIVEILDIGIAGEEPEQLVDDRLEVELLGRRQRKAQAEVESHLFPEYRQGAD